MRAKDYLDQIHRIDIRVGQRIAELNEMRARITYIEGIDYSKDRVQGTPSSGNKQIEDIVDIERDIVRLVETEAKMKHRIIGEIQRLENPVHVDLLFRRYVECQPFERIACDMGYVYNYVCNLHGEALKAFEEKVMKPLNLS